MPAVSTAAVPLTWWIIYRTRFGLRLRAVGENPAAVDTAGISVTVLRYSGVLICGIFAGIAGSYLAIAQSANFSPNMSGGRGFIALAALIFAKWNPIGALGACLLFGFLDTLVGPLQLAKLPSAVIPVIKAVILLSVVIVNEVVTVRVNRHTADRTAAQLALAGAAA